ncbi:hypothetical protein ABEH28_21190 [Pseudomonas sp. Ps21-P2]|uniref:hypothetical protein n=1 Tax=Pseudomonas sp. Ps21-P2 TaxID=3080331 RepID=UPI00320B6AA3
MKNSPESTYRQVANFVLLSQEIDEKLLSFSQPHFDAVWPAILVLDSEDEGGTVGLDKHYIPEDLPLIAWRTRLDIRHP